MDNVSRDFWWPGLYGDVRRWCNKCEFCRAERGATGLPAWTRTELYSCPFRVMQFDTITCENPRSARRTRERNTCSRAGVPIPDKQAETIAKGLMRIFCDCGSFPAVLRSDNAAEFIWKIVRELNQLLGVKHITGTAYHPRSQGAVESMHKTLNQ